MPTTKTLVICKSLHHNNTARVAHTIADVLGAVVVSPEEVPYTSLDDYALIGFGSGVYYGSFHEVLWGWVTCPHV
jgi:flavodoxin